MALETILQHLLWRQNLLQGASEGSEWMCEREDGGVVVGL